MSSKSKKIISVTDIMFVIAVIALIAVSVYKIGIFDRLFTRGKTETCTVTFVAERIATNQAGCIQAGENLFFGKDTLGVMRGGMLSNPSTDFILTDSGKYAFSESSDFVDVRGAFDTSFTSTEYGWLFGGRTYITPGTVLDVRCGDAEFRITVLSIDVRTES